MRIDFGIDICVLLTQYSASVEHRDPLVLQEGVVHVPELVVRVHPQPDRFTCLDLMILQRLKNRDLHHYFEVIAASAELGMAKPDQAIFEWALKQADCRPQDAVMVGDRMDNDIAPANHLGIHTIRLKRGLGAYHEPQSDDEVAEYTVSTLTELLDFL